MGYSMSSMSCVMAEWSLTIEVSTSSPDRPLRHIATSNWPNERPDEFKTDDSDTIAVAIVTVGWELSLSRQVSNRIWMFSFSNIPSCRILYLPSMWKWPSNVQNSQQFGGLKILMELDRSNESSPALSIVFVYGIEYPINTWTDPKTNSIWLAWLCKVKGLENVRIMTFEYDIRSKELYISDFAYQLIQDL